MLIWMFRRRLSRALRETIQLGEDFRQLSDDASTDFRQLSEKTREATNVVTEANTMEAATDDGLWMQLIVIESPKGTPWRRQPMQ